MSERFSGLALPRAVLLIVILPLAVFLFSEWVLDQFGRVDGATFAHPPRFHAAEEAAARYWVLAGFMAVISAAAAGLAYFLTSLLRLDSASRADAIGTFLLVCMSIIGLSLLPQVGFVETQHLVGERTVRVALSQPVDKAPQIESLHWNELGEEMNNSRPPDQKATAPIKEPRTRYEQFRELIDIEKAFLTIAIPALVIGSIACLAWPSRPPGPRLNRRLRNEQVKRLNLFLYLSAFLLVAGLMFLAALLYWPAAALHPDDRTPYLRQAQSVVLFHGVTYSLLLASFYLPVAGLLARRWRNPPEEKASEEAVEAPPMLGPLDVLKVGAAVFAPFVVGLLGEVMRIPGVRT